MEVLSRTATRFRPWLVRGKPAPRLLFFTDPLRTPDPEGVAERLPPGAAVVFRAFGAPDAEARGQKLRQITYRRGLLLLIGANAELAERLGADGLHLPERMTAELPAIRARHAHWWLTVAAHGEDAARAGAAAGPDALVVSPIFSSASPSAGPPLGVEALKRIVAAVPTPVYALGGVRASTVDQLLASGIIGIAAVEAFGA
ncbi:MAG: thiamine phosphate synthase [Gemmatimonadaceae bacterium]|nr:thiamine phosphate synthase [Caulobacter sp.]